MRVEFINFIPQACKVSRRHFLYYCQTKRILIGGFALLRSVIAQGLDVRLAGMVSKAVVKMCRCFSHLLDDTFDSYASDRSLHVTLAVNKTLEISQVGRPSVVNKQKK